MRYGLLGNLEVRRDDGTLADLGGIQPRRVLALLLAASGRVVPVDAVIDELWGDDVPASASGTLQSYISRLRRAIDPERTGSGRCWRGSRPATGSTSPPTRSTSGGSSAWPARDVSCSTKDAPPTPSIA